MSVKCYGAPGGGRLMILVNPYTEGPPGWWQRLGMRVDVFFGLTKPQLAHFIWWSLEDTPTWIKHNGYQIDLGARVEILRAALDGGAFCGQFSSLKVSR